MYSSIKKSQSGIAALLLIVIIGAVSLVMVKSAALIGIGEVDMAYTNSKAQETLDIAEGCAEETLRRLQIDPDYTANNFYLTLGNGSCVINSTINGNERIITAEGIVEEYYKKIEVKAIISNGQITIDNWQEISE